MKLFSVRRAAALVGVAMAVTTLPLISSGADAEETPAPGSDLITYTSPSLKYMCDVSATAPGLGPVALDDFVISAKVSFSLPPLTQRNVTLDPTDITIDLDLGEDLRYASREILGGYAADGASTNTVLSTTSNEAGTSRRFYRIPQLSAPKTAVPAKAGEPFVIRATGKSPSIPVPYTTKTTIGAPEQFDIASTIYTRSEDGVEGTIPVALSCDTMGNRKVATIKIGTAPTAMTAVVKPSTVKARKAGAILRVKIDAANPPTNGVLVYTEKGTVGANQQEIARGQIESNDGSVDIPLPAFGIRGKRTLKVFYEGDEKTDPKLVTAKFTVVK